MSKLSEKLHRLVERGELTWKEFMQIEAALSALPFLSEYITRAEEEDRERTASFRARAAKGIVDYQKRSMIKNHKRLVSQERELPRTKRGIVKTAELLATTPRTLKKARKTARAAS
jgi:hypothetical protein